MTLWVRHLYYAPDAVVFHVVSTIAIAPLASDKSDCFLRVEESGLLDLDVSGSDSLQG